MPLIINIDSATENASVCLALNGLSLVTLKNKEQKEHASFIYTAISSILETTDYKLKDIEGFAVTSGPGSYTGVRVSMAAAKGFCYALSKPLITVNTLEVMTKAALDTPENRNKNILFCPMIDARRMEVFTAVYNSNMECLFSPRSLILEEDVFKDFSGNKIIFFGSGSKKFMHMRVDINSVFADIEYDASHLGNLADTAFINKIFSNVSYSAPEYFKDFYSPLKAK